MEISGKTHPKKGVINFGCPQIFLEPKKMGGGLEDSNKEFWESGVPKPDPNFVDCFFLGRGET